MSMANLLSWANFAEAKTVLRTGIQTVFIVYLAKIVFEHEAWLVELDTEQERLAQDNSENATNIDRMSRDVDSKLESKDLENVASNQKLLVEKLERALQKLVEMKEKLREHERAIERLSYKGPGEESFAVTEDC